MKEQFTLIVILSTDRQTSDSSFSIKTSALFSIQFLVKIMQISWQKIQFNKLKYIYNDLFELIVV